MLRSVDLYDTTLRDGTQRAGISLSVDDKLRILERLDQFGVAYVEGGWPGSNPKDAELFARARSLPLKHTTLSAFGMTRRPSASCDDDPNLRALAGSGAPVTCIVGKASTVHVREILRTTLDENVAMVADSVAWLTAHGCRVFFDAEHFFDGYADDPSYAVEVLTVAAEAGADVVVLCDTNGGRLPDEVADVVHA
ncbi:MAG: citramalate synthase, partial [Actinomycetota bacterium]